MKTGDIDLLSHGSAISAAEEIRALVLRALLKRLIGVGPPLAVMVMALSGVIPLPRGWGETAVAAGLVLAYLWCWRILEGSVRLDAAAAEENVNELRRVKALEEVFRRKHREAMAVLEEAQEHGAPFALFLRNFSVEAADHITSEDPAGAGRRLLVRWIHVGGSALEAKLARELAPHLPLVKVANRSDLYLPETSVPAVLLGSDDWRELLVRLVAMASLIVVEVTHASEGIDFELRAILEQGKEHVTVLVLPDDLSEAEAEFRAVSAMFPKREALENLRRFNQRFPLPDDEERGPMLVRLVEKILPVPPSEWDPLSYAVSTSPVYPPKLPEELLRGFSRVVRAEELARDDVSDSPVFRKLLQAIGVIRSLSPDARAARERAISLHNRAMELDEAGSVEDALALFRASAVLLEEVGDAGSLASAHGEMGRVHLAAEDHAAAERHWARARELALRAKQREYAGKVTASLATSRLLRGDDSDEVRAMMMEAVDLERDAPDRQRARTFYTFYLLYLSRRSPAEAAAALVELAACRRREGAWETARQAYEEAARLYAEAGDAGRAAQLLAELGHIGPP